MNSTHITVELEREKHQQLQRQRQEEGFDSDADYVLHMVEEYLRCRDQRLLVAYWDDLKRHDWYFGMCDDRRVWQRGDENQRRLRAVASIHGEEFVRMYEAFQAFHQQAMRGDTPVPLPPRPRLDQ